MINIRCNVENIIKLKIATIHIHIGELQREQFLRNYCNSKKKLKVATIRWRVAIWKT